MPLRTEELLKAREPKIQDWQTYHGFKEEMQSKNYQTVQNCFNKTG